MKKALFAIAASTLIATNAFGKDIVDTAVSAGTFNTLATALKAAGLVDTLKGPGPFTVFAPTDAAFAKLPPDQLQALLADKAKLTAVLTYHVVPGVVMSKDVKPGMVKTVQGSNSERDHDGWGQGEQRQCHGRRHRRRQRRDPCHRHGRAAQLSQRSMHASARPGPKRFIAVLSPFDVTNQCSAAATAPARHHSPWRSHAQYPGTRGVESRTRSVPRPPGGGRRERVEPIEPVAVRREPVHRRRREPDGYASLPHPSASSVRTQGIR